MNDELIIEVNIGSSRQWFNDRINATLIESLFRFIDGSMLTSIARSSIIDIHIHFFSSSTTSASITSPCEPAEPPEPPEPAEPPEPPEPSAPPAPAEPPEP